MARTGGRSFGESVAQAARDIGRALGFSDRASVAERDRAISSNRDRFGGQAPNVSARPEARPAQASMIGRADRDGPDRREAAQPAAPPPPPVVEPVQPPVVETPAPPAAPLPVNPSDMTSTGAVEDTAMESAQQGRAATILTGAQGLLAEEEPRGLLRRRRSLVGGGLIA